MKNLFSKEKVESFKKKYPAYMEYDVSVGNSGDFLATDKFYITIPPYNHTLVVEDLECLGYGPEDSKAPNLSKEELREIRKHNEEILKVIKLAYPNSIGKDDNLFTDFDYKYEDEI